MLPLSYILVLIESFLSNEKEYVDEPIAHNDVIPYINSIIQTKPTISTYVECYHYETRTRTVYYTDSNGNSQSRVETYQEFVLTWSGSQEYQYTSWKDNSDVTEIPTFHATKMTRLKLKKDVDFDDDETRNDYDRSENEFIEANRHRDVLIHATKQIFITDLKERLMVYGRNKMKPWWMNKCCYWLAVVLFMTWPYRLLLKRASGKEEYKFVKRVSVRPQIDASCVPMTYVCDNVYDNPGMMMNDMSPPSNIVQENRV